MSSPSLLRIGAALSSMASSRPERLISRVCLSSPAIGRIQHAHHGRMLERLTRGFVDDVVNVAQRLSARLRVTPTGHLLRGRIQIIDVTQLVGGNNGVAHGVQRDFRMLFFPGQRLFHQACAVHDIGGNEKTRSNNNRGEKDHDQIGRAVFAGGLRRCPFALDTLQLHHFIQQAQHGSLTQQIVPQDFLLDAGETLARNFFDQRQMQRLVNAHLFQHSVHYQLLLLFKANFQQPVAQLYEFGGHGGEPAQFLLAVEGIVHDEHGVCAERPFTGDVAHRKDDVSLGVVFLGDEPEVICGAQSCA